MKWESIEIFRGQYRWSIDDIMVLSLEAGEYIYVYPSQIILLVCDQNISNAAYKLPWRVAFHDERPDCDDTTSQGLAVQRLGRVQFGRVHFIAIY